MAEHITNGSVAEIYIEEVDVDSRKMEMENNVGRKDEMCEADDEAEEMDLEVPCSMPADVATTVTNVDDKDLAALQNFYKSPSKLPKIVPNDGDIADKEGKLGDQLDSSDYDYQPKDLNSSGDDEEAEQLRQFAKQIKKNNRAKKLGETRSQALILADATVPELNNLEDDGSPYLNETIRCKVMVRIQENRAKAQKWQGKVCPNIFKKLKLNIERSDKCHVLWNGDQGFEVKEKNKRRFTVNLEQKTCSCRYWQLSGLPCCHAISAIYMASKNLDDYIASCYSISDYMKTYQFCLQPVEGQENWPISEMPKPLPPAYVKMPGRPKTQRTREPQEKPKGTKVSRVGIKMKCSACHSTKHNIRTCTYKKEAGSKKNAYIKRDSRKRKQAETASDACPSAKTSCTNNFDCSESPG